MVPRLWALIVLQQGGRPGCVPALPPAQTHQMAITDDPLETTRNLLDREATVRHGFLDVLGESVDRADAPRWLSAR